MRWPVCEADGVCDAVVVADWCLDDVEGRGLGGDGMLARFEPVIGRDFGGESEEECSATGLKRMVLVDS